MTNKLRLRQGGIVFLKLDGTYPPSPLTLRVVDHKNFRLVEGFIFRPVNGTDVLVPAHDENNPQSVTDLASVPRPLWGLLASYGRQLRAAIMHDHLCDEVADLPAGTMHERRVAYSERRRADDLFHMAMRDRGDGTPDALVRRVSWFRAWVFWAGVSYGRYWDFRKFRCVALTLHVLLATAASYLVVVGLMSPHWLRTFLGWAPSTRWTCLLIWALVLLSSLAWAKDWRLPLIGTIVGPIALPILLLTLIAQFLLALPDILITRIVHSEPPAHIGPTTVKFGG